MQDMAAIVICGLSVAFFLWKWCDFCARWGWKVVCTVIAVDGVLSLTGLNGGFLLIGPLSWKVWLLYADSRWEPARGVFPLPAWPRAPRMRGPGKRRRRLFREPMPWTAGPNTY